MADRTQDRKPRSSVVAIVIGVLMYLLGLAAWFALVPVTFLGSFYNQTHDPVTRSLLMVFLVFYAILSGSGTGIVLYRLSWSHWGSRIMAGIFLFLLVLGLANFAWQGTLPNGFENGP